MTRAQRYLLAAARGAADYFERHARGVLPRGQHEDYLHGRALKEAIAAVDAEQSETQYAAALTDPRRS